MATDIHVSISAEPIFQLGGQDITNSMLTGVVVSILLAGFSIWFSKRINKTKSPKGIQNLVEMVLEGLYNLMISITSEKKTKEFFPVIATLFLYILFSNWIELLPGVGTIGLNKIIHGETTFAALVRPPSADLNSTIGLALISVVGSQVVGLKYLKLSYLKKFFDFSNMGKFFLGILELTSEISRIISFAFRLFGNIFAGEVLLAVSLALLPLIAPIPFLGLEIFVGMIQALVFAVLTLVFWHMATIPHGSDH